MFQISSHIFLAFLERPEQLESTILQILNDFMMIAEDRKPNWLNSLSMNNNLRNLSYDLILLFLKHCGNNLQEFETIYKLLDNMFAHLVKKYQGLKELSSSLYSLIKYSDIKEDYIE